MTQVNRAVAFIFVTVLLNSVGFGIVMPVLPELIVDITADPLHQAALHAGWLSFVYALMQFFFSPLAGNLSDRFGRRPVLLASLLVFGIDYLIMGLAPTMAWLYVGRLVAGISATSFAIANACVADLFPPEKRAQNFGLMGAAFGVGFILGPVIGGFLGEFGPRMPFFATAGIALGNVVFGFFALPETLSTEHRRPFRLARANPLGAFRQLAHLPVVVGLLGAHCLYALAQNALPVIWAFFTMEQYGWGPRDVGFSLGAVGVCMLIVQGFVIRRVIPAWGVERVAVVGLVLAVVSFFGYAFAAPVGWTIYVWIVVGSGMGLVGPAVNGILSRHVPPNAQGELQGVIGSVASGTFVISPIVMTQLFGYFTSPAAPVYFPGAAFALSGVLVLASLAMVRRTLARPAEAA